MNGITLQEAFDVLDAIATKKQFISMDDYEEYNELYNRWNAYVPKAEKAGVKHSQMNDIWNSYRWRD